MDEVLSLIGQLYDAALDPDLWAVVLVQLTSFLDTARTLLVLEDAINPLASIFYASAHDPDWYRRYTESYMLINPARLAMVGRVNGGDTVLTTDFMTEAEYRATRFSREFLAERRIADIAVAVLEKTASRITVLSAQRSFEQGFADELLRRKLQLIMPHAQRAVRIARLLEHHKLASATLADTLDRLEAAVFLVTSFGVVVHANRQATRLLEAADVAQTVHGNLTLSDRAAGSALANALAMATQGDAAFGAEGRSIAAVARSHDKFIVTVMPLTTGRRRAIGSPYEAVAAVCIKAAEFEVPVGASTLATFYDLTRREMAVFVAAIELEGVPEIAAVMGITEATVRSHLKAIFRKTGATRQADLVKLMAGIAGPIGPARNGEPNCQ